MPLHSSLQVFANVVSSVEQHNTAPLLLILLSGGSVVLTPHTSAEMSGTKGSCTRKYGDVSNSISELHSGSESAGFASETAEERKRRLAAARQRRHRERLSEEERQRRRIRDAGSKRRRRYEKRILAQLIASTEILERNR